MKALFAKLLKVQERMKAVTKEEVNPMFKSKYYDINGLLSQLKPVLNEVGLVVLQPLTMSGEKTVLQTTVLDPETAEQLSWQVEIPTVGNIQQIGAAISYMRRYSLSSCFLLEAEDDDGASSPKKKNPYDVAVEMAGKLKAGGSPERKQEFLAKVQASVSFTPEQKKTLEQML